MKHAIISIAVVLWGVAMAQVVQAEQGQGRASGSRTEPTFEDYQYKETRELVQLVNDATDLIRTKAEAAFAELRRSGSRWRHDDTYIFVFDPEGNMLVHPDPAMEGRNQLDLKDVDGRPIIRGLLGTAMEFPDKPAGWYHYEWPVPNGILPRWNSSYVRRVEVPSGKTYLVCSGMYNDRMEKAFVVDLVKNAVSEIERNGDEAFQRFRDPAGPFLVKNVYVFVIDSNGVELVNPAFPNLEGRNLLDLVDAGGDRPIREMFKVAESPGFGWVDYMWPKPGESVATQKSAYVSKAKLEDKWLLVGCGVYLADATKATTSVKRMAGPELVMLVREAAEVLEQQGEEAFPEFRKKGSKWYRDNTYFFVWTLDGIRVFHAADPAGEGQNVSSLKDVLGRPIGSMFLDTAATSAGEGWVHYMYPEPGDIFPAWKSTFVKRVRFPSGKEYVVGCGIYNMQMNKAFIENLVDRAAGLVAERGEAAFPQLRDKAGPFVFMDEYVFVFNLDGVNLVNPAHRSLEGKNMISVRDAIGQPFVSELIGAAANEGSAWVNYHWYKPGDNAPLPKHTYVRKVQSGDGVYIVGAGFYVEDNVVYDGDVTND
jgi:signal transduction histidine kinase